MAWVAQWYAPRGFRILVWSLSGVHCAMPDVAREGERTVLIRTAAVHVWDHLHLLVAAARCTSGDWSQYPGGREKAFPNHKACSPCHVGYMGGEHVWGGGGGHVCAEGGGGDFVRTYPPPFARATLKFQNWNWAETTTTVALTMALSARAARRPVRHDGTGRWVIFPSPPPKDKKGGESGWQDGHRYP